MSPNAPDSTLSLLPITEARPSQLAKMLSIRNEDAVRKNMYQNKPISPDIHDAWLKRACENEYVRYFLVFAAGAQVGTLAYTRIDFCNLRADWAFYLSSAAQGKGLGKALEKMALQHAFETMGLNKLNCEVIEWNTPVLGLHKKFGFREEGRRRAHVFRDGVFCDAVLLGLLRDEWLACDSTEESAAHG